MADSEEMDRYSDKNVTLVLVKQAVRRALHWSTAEEIRWIVEQSIVDGPSDLSRYG